jgi:YgiT-type zinc finger domain-containing protein
MCKSDTKEGYVNYPVDRDQQFLLIKNVPAHICNQCGEYFLDDDVFKTIEKIIEKTKDSNVEIEILRFAA